jgi:hypothetical protein
MGNDFTQLSTNMDLQKREKLFIPLIYRINRKTSKYSGRIHK